MGVVASSYNRGPLENRAFHITGPFYGTQLGLALIDVCHPVNSATDTTASTRRIAKFLAAYARLIHQTTFGHRESRYALVEATRGLGVFLAAAGAS